MKLLADAGIYLALDVNSPQHSLNNEYAEATRRSYNDVYLQNVFATIDAFSKYQNTLLFFAGNEVIYTNETWTAPFVKAVIRDMKQYIQKRGYRSIPVGYAAKDIEDSATSMAAYANCGPDPTRADFMAFNDYSFCGTPSFGQSSWSNKTKLYSHYNIPLL